MGGAWELLIVCPALNLNLSPIWLLLLLCPCQLGEGGCMRKEESAVYQAGSPVPALS